MKRKSVLMKVLATTLAASMIFAGCGQKAAAPAAGEATEGTATEGTATEGTATEGTDSAASGDEMTIEFYDVAANYQGEQTGWYGKVLKDELNIKLNIIAPQVSGDPTALYQTRCSSGNLGDIVILENTDMLECVDAGLIQPMDITNYPNLCRVKEQIDLYNKDLGDGTKTYAIPTEMNTNGPTAYMAETVLSYPSIPWNLYSEQGCPEIKDLDGLLDLLKKIQDAHPTNEDGDPAYAISLWPDWDNTSIETVNQMTKWYGQEVKESVMLGTDNSIMPLTDKNGAYYKMLKFLFKANQMGLVDPDSATQDWTTVCDNKMKKGRVYLFWYNWQRGFWNTPERGEQGLNYTCVPVADTNIYQPSDYYYGSGRAWGIGSQVDEAKKERIMQYLDWLASPAGATFQHAGTEGLVYTVNEDGTFKLTDEGFNRFTNDIQVPEDQGGGLWADGNNMVNQWILQDKDTNPETGECYDTNLWSSTIEANMTKTTKEWIEKFGAKNEVEYYKQAGLLTPIASVNKILAIDDTDTSLIRGQCAELTKDGSWKMIFAKDEAEFDKMWDEMVEQMNGLGWEKLVAFDTEKYQVLVDARIAASK